MSNKIYSTAISSYISNILKLLLESCYNDIYAWQSVAEICYINRICYFLHGCRAWAMETLQ